MISLSATSYDPNGSILIDAVLTNPYEARRRGSVTATLDGASSVYDTGYSVSDYTLKATIKYPSKLILDTLKYLVAYYGQVILACDIGVYTVIPEFVLNKDTLNLSMRIFNRLDQ